MSGLKIAFLLNRGPVTWQAQDVFHFRLCRALVARGASPVLVYAGKASEDVLSRMRESGAEVITGVGLHGWRHYYRVLGATFRRFNIDLVHVRWFVCQSIVHWMVRSHSVRRIIYTEANSWLPSNRGLWSLKRLLTRTRTKLACWPITRFIAVSQFVRDRLFLYGVDADRIVVVYNGIDVDRFAPDSEARIAWRGSHGICEDEVVISTVGRLDPDKDHETILCAFEELLKREVLAHLFVAGAGRLGPELKALSRRLGLTERTHWLGHVGDPVPLLQGSDILVLPSVGEACSCALAEAMACALPCVSSRCGGNAEVVEDGVTGILATARDPVSFADAIEVLARDSDRREAMGRAGLDRVRRLFTVDRAVENTLAVYEELLD